MPEDSAMTDAALTDTQRGWIETWVLKSKPELVKLAYGKPGGFTPAHNIDLGAAPAKLAARLVPIEKGMISAADWNEVGTEMDQASAAFMSDYEAKVAAAKTEATRFKKIEALLPVLNKPSNNPERGKIDQKLKEFEGQRTEFEKQIAAESDAAKKLKLEEQLVNAQTRHLNALEMDLNVWFNRRTEKGLPPSPEALAMADLVQKEHRAMIETCITKGISPPPVADMELMTKDEIKDLKASWDKLVDQSGPIKIRESVVVDNNIEKAAREHQEITEGIFVDDAAMKKLRIQLLSDMNRLMGSPSGRDIINGLETSGKTLYFTAGKNPECVGFGNTSDTKGSIETAPEAGKDIGEDSAVCIPLGRKNSDEILRTEDGNLLYSPTHVIIGHEMVHALHNAQGVGRGSMPKGALDPIWTNLEEIWTIKKGELSEQTLRNDYNLSADRFGHGWKEAEEDLVNKALAQTEKSKKLLDLAKGKDGVKVDKVLAEDRKFGDQVVALMDDAIKFDLYDSKKKPKGPLPKGWDPSRLDVDKIIAIVKDQLPYRMGMLGWTAYNIPYDKGSTNTKTGFPDDIVTITKNRVHHWRSAAGRQFTALEGKTAIEAFTTFKTKTGTDLGSWNGTDWRANLRTLIAANRRVDGMVAGIPFVKGETDPARVVTAKDKLCKKMTRIAAIFDFALSGKTPEEAGPLFADGALAHFKYSGADDTDARAVFLKSKLAGLSETDAELKKGGLAVASMTLVARDKAAQALKAFKEQSAFKTYLTTISEAEKAADQEEGAVEAAAKKFALALSQMLTLDGWLAQNAENAVATSIRKLHLDHAADTLMKHTNFGKISFRAMEENETAAKDLFKGTPRIEDVLSNSMAEQEFAEYLEKTPNQKRAYNFYFMVYMRKTVEIADAAQGTALMDCGFTQDTVVRLGRDAADTEALQSAQAEAHALLSGYLTKFLKTQKAAV